MTRLDAFKHLDAAHVVTLNAEWFGDDAVLRGHRAWVAAGSPPGASIEFRCKGNRDGEVLIHTPEVPVFEL